MYHLFGNGLDKFCVPFAHFAVIGNRAADYKLLQKVNDDVFSFALNIVMEVLYEVFVF